VQIRVITRYYTLFRVTYECCTCGPRLQYEWNTRNYA
jgi:hypothetical protein